MSCSPLIATAPRVNNAAICGAEITAFPKVTTSVVPALWASNCFAGGTLVIVTIESRQGAISRAGDDGFLRVVTTPVPAGWGTVLWAIRIGFTRIEITAKISTNSLAI